MAKVGARMNSADGVSARFLRLAIAMVGLALAWQPGAVHAVPLLAQAGQALVAPGLDQAAKPVKPAGEANAAAGGGAAASAGGDQAKGGSNSLMKYAPSYVLLALMVSLGTFIICRPKPRPAATK